MKDLVKSVLKVFDGKQKRKLVGMMFLILINSGVSLLGVSVLSPFITAVMNPEELLKNDIIRSVYDGFHMQNTNQLITIAVSCVKLLSAHNSTQHTSRKHKV